MYIYRMNTSIHTYATPAYVFQPKKGASQFGHFFPGSPSGTGDRNVEGPAGQAWINGYYNENKHDIFAAAAKPPKEWQSPLAYR